jgi:hypothetical protein
VSKPDLECPKCDQPLNFLGQVEEWVEIMGGEGVKPPAFLNIWCETCGSMTTSIYWEENGPDEEYEVPNLREIMDGIDRLVTNKPLVKDDE